MLKELIASQLPDQSSPVFSRLLDMLVKYLGDILSVAEEGKFDYLSPLVAMPRDNDELLTISTLNHDLGLELVARRDGSNLSW